MKEGENIHKERYEAKVYLKKNLKYGDIRRISDELKIRYHLVARCISPDFEAWNKKVIEAAYKIAKKNIEDTKINY